SGPAGAAYTDINQQDHLKISEVGGSVNLSCVTSKASRSTIAWMKQKLGEKPLLIATSYQRQPAAFYNDFDKDGRFEILIAAEHFNLSISNIEPSDSATYYCASLFIYEISFGNGTYLLVKGASPTKHKVLQQPVMNPEHPGDSATLQCTVNTQSCSGDHSVYWFRHRSGESDPGIIFTHGDSSSQCTRSSETVSPTQGCIYKLHKNNLSLSDAGTYYCAVAACGEILFGNGTKMDFTGKKYFIPLVLILSNVFFLLAVILFVVLQCKKQKQSEGDLFLCLFNIFSIFLYVLTAQPLRFHHGKK
uniref:Ig-like domain-containing protein n=1 Tax=Astyanax mexicanus TaxID=7994 RepID=A0A3B1JFN4_ASTMX